MHRAGVHVPRRRPASDSTEVLSPLPWEVEDEGKNLRRFGGSLLGSLFGWTKPRPLGSASRKGCGGKRREPTAPSISRAPWVLECRAVGTCGVFFSTGHGFGDQKTDRLLLSFTAINSIGALSIVSARRRMFVLNKSLPDPGSNGIRGKYLISAVYFLCGLASDVLLKTPARAGVVLKSPYEPRNKSAKNSHLPISRRPRTKISKEGESR